MTMLGDLAAGLDSDGTKLQEMTFEADRRLHRVFGYQAKLLHIQTLMLRRGAI